MKTIEKILNLEEGSYTIAATGQGYNRIIIVLRKNGEEIAPKFIIRKNETRYIGTLKENIFKTKPLNAESVVNDIIATIQCGLAHDFKDWEFTKTL